MKGALKLISKDTVNATIGSPPHRFFMKGDGHRKPPFQWALATEVTAHFEQLVANNSLCLHVEQHQKDVCAASVPSLFNAVLTKGKVFGWELPIYADLGPLMEIVAELQLNLDKPLFNAIKKVHLEMAAVKSKAGTVGNPAWIAEAVATSDVFQSYWKSVLRFVPSPEKRDNIKETAYVKFLLGYNKSAMMMRTQANNHIAASIKKSIDLFPNDTHLITLGDAHLTDNPVQNYLNIGGAIGVVDEDQW